MTRATRSIGLAGILAMTLASSALPQPAEPPALRDLQSLDQLKTAFNRDAGKPRLVLLLSPT